MQRRHVYILAVMTASLPIAALAGTWIPPSQTAPSGNVEGPVWLQTGGPSPQTGNFSVSGIGTIGGNANVGGDLWANNNIYMPTGKTIRIDGAGVTTLLNFGNFNPAGTGFSANIQGDLTVSGQGSSGFGELTTWKMCLLSDATDTGYGPGCRLTWPAGGGAPADIWVDTTGDAMTGQLNINISTAGQGAISTNNSAISGYGGYFTAMQGSGVLGIGAAEGVYGAGDTGAYFVGTGAGGRGLYAQGLPKGVEALCTAAGCTGGYFTGTAYGVTGWNADGSEGHLAYGTMGVFGSGILYGVQGYGGTRGVTGNGGTAGVYGSGGESGVYGVLNGDPSKWGALGYSGYGVYSGSDIFSAGNKGVVLDALDRPLITRGHDPFTSGIYSGLGRWGLFKVANTLVAGIPNIAGKSFKVSKYELNGDNTDLLTVTDAGKVGIGTTAPDYNLTVSGAVSSYMNIKDGTRNILMGVDAGGASISVLSAHNLLFKTSNVEKMRIMDSTGYVGIGTTAPANMLTVKGNGTGVVNIGTNGCLGNFSGISLNGSSMSGSCGTYNILSSPDQTLIFNRPTFGAILFRENNATQMMIASSTGYVGIGTTSPTQKLHVVGDAYKSVGGTSWAATSDARLKNVDGSYQRGLDAVEKLSPVYFHYKSDNPLGLSSDEQNVGLIAQDVKKVIPEAIGIDNQGYFTLHSDPILWAMLNSIKELKAENDALKARVEALEKK